MKEDKKSLGREVSKEWKNWVRPAKLQSTPKKAHYNGRENQNETAELIIRGKENSFGMHKKKLKKK